MKEYKLTHGMEYIQKLILEIKYLPISVDQFLICISRMWMYICF